MGATASAVSAAELHSGVTSTTFITFDQHGANVLDTPAGNISCTTNTGRAAFTGTTTQEARSLASANIDTMGCTYTATASTETTGIAHIECSGANKITITPTSGSAAICHISIPPQAVNLAIANTSATAGGIPDDIGVTPESVIEYDVVRTAGGAKCPTEGEHTDGRYTGSTTIRAYQDSEHKEQVNVTYE
jgi:hypothetical protein